MASLGGSTMSASAAAPAAFTLSGTPYIAAIVSSSRRRTVSSGSRLAERAPRHRRSGKEKRRVQRSARLRRYRLSLTPDASDRLLDQIVDRREQVRVVCERRGERRATCFAGCDPARDESRDRDEQPRPRSLGEPLIAQPADLDGELGECARRSARHAALVHHDLHLARGGREVELDRDEALPRARLEVLERVLVARVVRDDELEPRRGG